MTRFNLNRQYEEQPSFLSLLLDGGKGDHGRVAMPVESALFGIQKILSDSELL